MTSITPPADDTGVQSLRQSNRADTNIEPVSRLATACAIHSSAGVPVAGGLHIDRRRRADRRREDRRQRKQKVLLDTRSYHDRRTAERRSFTKKRTLPHTRGINIKV
ncbi:MAG TPA: hypothetical protein ENI68_10415 [Gammaproteobacteria bacterium]|nr:hypothetical protein [Gammaproteobacteria bacterium]